MAGSVVLRPIFVDSSSFVLFLHIACSYIVSTTSSGAGGRYAVGLHGIARLETN